MEIWRRSESSTPGLTMVSGMVLGALLVALAWYFLAPPRQAGDGEQAARVVSSGSPRPSSGGTSANALARPVTALSKCQAVAAAQRQPLRTASAAMAQWQVHIGAMNKLVTGMITLQQANQFWNQTRIAARDHLRDFSRASAGYDRQASQCPLTGSGSPALRACQQAIAEHDAVLRSARHALATWSMHVMNMNMLRNGQMSPTTATTLWVQNWHAGQREVDRYQAALNKADTSAAHC